MDLSDDSPFYRLLATRYDADREAEAIAILEGHPQLARLEWAGTDGDAQPFVAGSTALHYAANDGKLSLARKLIEYGADVNASNAQWYRSVLAWAANNARVETIQLLLAHGRGRIRSTRCTRRPGAALIAATDTNANTPRR